MSDEDKKPEMVVDAETPLVLVPPAQPFRVMSILWPHFTFMVIFYVGLVGSTVLVPQYILTRLREEYSINDTNSKSAACSVNASDSTNLQERLMEEEASRISAIAAFCCGVPAFLTVSFYSSLSDHFGRKVTMIIPYVGEVVLIIGVAVMVVFQLPFWTFYIVNVINGLCGSYTAVIAGVFASVADVSPPEQRAIIMGILQGSLGLSSVASNLLVGLWSAETGYSQPAICLAGIAIFSSIFFIPIQETNPRNSSGDVRVGIGRNIKKQWRHMVRTIFFNNQRAQKVFLLVACLALTNMAYAAVMAPLTIYVMGRPFCWQSTAIGYYNISRILSVLIGSTVGVVLLKRFLSDYTLTILGTISFILYNFFTGIAGLFPYPLYLIFIIVGVPCGIISILQFVTIRSLTSKTVTNSEQGAIFGLLAIGETFTSNFGPVISNAIYAATVTTMTWFIFLFCTVLLLILLLLMIIYKYLENQENYTEPETCRRELVTN